MKRQTKLEPASPDRSRAEALTEQLVELDHLYQTAPVGLCLMDRDLRFVRVNEKLAAINGKPVVEHIGRTLREVIPEIAQKVEPIYRRVMETGEPALDFEVQGTTGNWNGTALVSFHPLKSDDGTVQGVSTVVQDITERKRAEAALRRTEEHLRPLLETTKVIPWEASAETWQFTYVGPQAVKLLGYPVDQWYEKDFWISHIHPDDREPAIDFCLKASSRCEDYEFEYRMVSSDERILWLHDLVSVECTDGAPKVLRGFMIDITERKRTEQALSQSEAALRHSQKDL
ncbi:MAG: PAS domain-containing protein, partial [Alphaproteobacteria bacterium]